MSQQFAATIESIRGSVVLLDGGMGQELLRRWGKPPQPGWSADVLRQAPNVVEQLHYDYIVAGSSVITLSGYTLTPERLARDGRASELAPLQARAIEVAMNARDRAQTQLQRCVDIAGCLPPLVASYRPLTNPEHCLQSYQRLCALQAPAVDFFICETMSSIAEAHAAASAALATSKPCWVAFSVDDADGNKLRSGESLLAAVAAMRDYEIDALLINCSAPEATAQALELLADAQCPRYGAYANAFTTIAPLQPGGTTADLRPRPDITPERYSLWALDWLAKGASIVGGCCEINPEHIAQIAQDLLAAGYKVVHSQ